MATAPAAPSPLIPLDADQLLAAAHDVGTGAVSASAGAGKTTLLIGRAVRLAVSGVSPRSILTLAFNRSAAATLRERLAAHPATAGHEDAMASTFHAFALSCVRLVTPSIRVLPTSAEEAAGQTTDDGAPMRTVRDVSRACWETMGGAIYGVSRPAIVRGTSLDDLMSVEPGARERLFAAGWPGIASRPDDLRAALGALKLKECSAPTLAALAVYMPLLRAEKQRLGAVDFTDMLLGLGHYIRKNEPGVMARLASIQHLQIDEAQDGNELRWYIAEAVAAIPGAGRSVMAVGDLRQSINGFAGAMPALFRAWWDKADAKFELPRNYRSASAIVAAGNAVAEGESWKLGMDAVAARPDLGLGSVRVEPVGTLAIANEIACLIEEGTTHKDVTVLARTRAALETVAFGLRTKGLKVVVRGGGFVWRGMDGRMIRAYLDLAEARCCDVKAGVMALNRPLRYVSAPKLTSWVTNERLNAQLYREASGNRPYRPAAAVVAAVETMAGLSWVARVEQVQTWLLAGLEADRVENAEAPGSNSDKADLIRNLCSIASACGSVETLNIAIEAETKLDPKAPDVIELSTIHQAKGDQWGTVYLTGVREGVFPHGRASGDEEFAEETRLLYVAVTRPVHTLVVDVTAGATRFEPKLAALAGVVTPPPEPEPEGGMTPDMEDSQREDLSDEGDVERRADALRHVPVPATSLTHPAPPSAAPEGSTGPHGFIASLIDDRERALALTAHGAQPSKGQKFVTVTWSELQQLLKPHGFVEDQSARVGQRVLTSTLKDGAQLKIYTSIPPGSDAARALGADSMKVAMISAAGKPMASKQKPMSRTKNWRSTLLARLVTLLQAHPAMKVSA